MYPFCNFHNDKTLIQFDYKSFAWDSNPGPQDDRMVVTY